jgi:predicted nucleic acid-binding protein
MTGRIFLDTNLFVYAYDVVALTKADLALNLIDRIGAARAGILSAQVLSEFFNMITRKISVPLSIPEGRRRVEALLLTWTVAPVTELIVLEAVRGVEQHQLNFWDAQIWAAARLNHATVILSEDFQDGRTLEGVRFANPFKEGFRLDRWL